MSERQVGILADIALARFFLGVFLILLAPATN